VVISAVAVAASLPAIFRFALLVRGKTQPFETHGAANDPRY